MFEKRTKGLIIRHPIIFPAQLVHADVAKMLTCDIGPLAGFKPISAGEVSLFRVDTVNGSSSTLGLKADPKRDTYIISMNDYGGGMS
jgi:hypothetical protein